MKITFFVIILVSSALILLFTPDLMSAQPGFPSNPSQAPIDGGLGLLAAGGAAYAVKKIRESRNKE